MHKLQTAEQMRKALQKFALTLSVGEAMEVACVFDSWTPDTRYTAGERLTHGKNAVGDPQLYEVCQTHVSAAGAPPDVAAALYTPIGLDDRGYPIWAPPTGAHDAYDTGDVVDMEGILYESLIDGNTTVPGTDERYWRKYE